MINLPEAPVLDPAWPGTGKYNPYIQVHRVRQTDVYRFRFRVCRDESWMESWMHKEHRGKVFSSYEELKGGLNG